MIDKKEYESTSAIVLFEDEYSFSFGKINVEYNALKFSWNSKGVVPEIEFIEGTSLVFIGVDNYVVGYYYRRRAIAFYLNTVANFKWFEKIANGIGMIAETDIILLNTTSFCTLRNCHFFGDTIMGTSIEKNRIKVDFLIDESVMINI